MKRLVLLCLVATAVGCGDESGGSDDASWAVVDGLGGGSMDGGSTADSELVQDVQRALDLSTDLEVAAVMDVPAPEDAPLSEPDTVTAPDIIEAEETWAGGILLFEIASTYINSAGVGARFTESGNALSQLVGEPGTSVWGPCTESLSNLDGSGAPPLFGYDAGLITISGTTPVVELTPTDEGEAGTGYSTNLSEDLTSLLPAGGALLTIQGAGGADIEAFEMVAQVPEPVNLISPKIGLFDAVSGSESLTVSWDAGSGDAVLVTTTPLDDSFSPTSGMGLFCWVEGDPGTLEIPAEAIGAVTASGIQRIALVVSRISFSSASTSQLAVPATIARSSGGPLNFQ